MSKPPNKIGICIMSAIFIAAISYTAGWGGGKKFAQTHQNQTIMGCDAPFQLNMKHSDDNTYGFKEGDIINGQLQHLQTEIEFRNEEDKWRDDAFILLRDCGHVTAETWNKLRCTERRKEWQKRGEKFLK